MNRGGHAGGGDAGTGRAHLHSVGSHVRDLPAAVGFYRLLGIDAPPVTDGDTVAAATVGANPPADGTEPPGAAGPPPAPLTLTWATTDALRTLDGDRVDDPTLRLQIEIGYDTSVALGDAWTRATAAGHRGVISPFDAPWGVRLAVLDDPDGNRVALTAPLPTT